MVQLKSTTNILTCFQASSFTNLHPSPLTAFVLFDHPFQSRFPVTINYQIILNNYVFATVPEVYCVLRLSRQGFECFKNIVSYYPVLWMMTIDTTGIVVFYTLENSNKHPSTSPLSDISLPLTLDLLVATENMPHPKLWLFTSVWIQWLATSWMVIVNSNIMSRNPEAVISTSRHSAPTYNYIVSVIRKTFNYNIICPDLSTIPIIDRICSIFHQIVYLVMRCLLPPSARKFPTVTVLAISSVLKQKTISNIFELCFYLW